MRQPNWKTVRAMCLDATGRMGTYCFSVVGTIICPMIPVLIEWFKTSHLRHESVLITAAVLSAALLVTAEHNFSRAAYLLIFLVSLILHVLVFSGPIESGMDVYAGNLLASVAILHAVERFWWHVVQDRPFPDSLRT